MCLALPLQVKEMAGGYAIMANGRRAQLDGKMKVAKGDWLLVQFDIALEKLSAKKAKAMTALIKSIQHDN